MKSLFNENETYTQEGHALSEEAYAWAEVMLEKYKDVPTRDVVTIITDALDCQAVFKRVDRRLKENKS